MRGVTGAKIGSIRANRLKTKEYILKYKYPDFKFDLSQEDLVIDYYHQGTRSVYSIGIKSSRYFGLTYYEIMNKLYDDICKVEEME